MKLILKYFFGAIKNFKTAFIVPLMLMLVMALLSAVTPYFSVFLPTICLTIYHI